jgi:serine/threonine protein kinase
LLAGRRPFQSSTDLELLQTIIHLPAAPFGADVPLVLRMVVEKALEKDPAERYQSTRDLVVDLRRTPQRECKIASVICIAGLVMIRPGFRKGTSNGKDY